MAKMTLPKISIPTFALGFGGLPGILRQIESLDPEHDLIKGIEVLVMHNPETCNLDDPRKSYLDFARKTAKPIKERGYKVIAIGFEPSQNPPRLHVPGEEQEMALQRRYAMIEIAAEMGSEVLGGPTQGNHRDWRDNIYADILAVPLRKMVAKGREEGVTIALEMLRREEMNGFNIPTGMRAILRRVPGLKLHTDTCHFYDAHSGTGLGIAQSFQRLGRYVAHHHFSSWGPMNSTSNRGPLNQGPVSEELVDVLSALRRIGYKGFNGIETFHPALYSAVGRESPYASPEFDANPKAQSRVAFAELALSFEALRSAVHKVYQN